MKKVSGILLLSLGLALGACSSGDGGGDDSPEQPVVPTNPTGKLPITISVSVAGVSDTKATDYGFETGDRIGLYVVNRTDGTAGTLLSSGNHVDNMAFTYNGTWTAATPIYWADDKTHADFYLYYPYTAGIADVEAMIAESGTRAVLKRIEVRQSEIYSTYDLN